MLNESQQRPKPRRQHIVPVRRQGETNHVQIEMEKREGREEKIITVNINNARKKTARKGNTHTSVLQGAQLGCSAETK